jgi:hypothetical protein
VVVGRLLLRESFFLNGIASVVYGGWKCVLFGCNLIKKSVGDVYGLKFFFQVVYIERSGFILKSK